MIEPLSVVLPMNTCVPAPCTCTDWVPVPTVTVPPGRHDAQRQEREPLARGVDDPAAREPADRRLVRGGSRYGEGAAGIDRDEVGAQGEDWRAAVGAGAQGA